MSYQICDEDETPLPLVEFCRWLRCYVASEGIANGMSTFHWNEIQHHASELGVKVDIDGLLSLRHPL
jgi:hypothetical protein